MGNPVDEPGGRSTHPQVSFILKFVDRLRDPCEQLPFGLLSKPWFFPFW
jgi:hypothetical protein